MTQRTGKLIAAMGLPGCGKSSVFGELAQLHNLEVFHEPEEDTWGRAVKERDVCGHFTGITWFRAERVPDLFRADHSRRSGEVVLVDSYYDKLWAYWVGKPGMEWLIDPADPYFEVAVALAEIDRHRLPDADVLVLFKVSPEIWSHFINTRNRQLDRQVELLKTFPTQEYFEEAASLYCDEAGARLIVYSQRISSAAEAAAELSQLLLQRGVTL